HRGPRGLLTSCPIAASSFGARPLIGSAGEWSLSGRPLARRKKVAAVQVDAIARATSIPPPGAPNRRASRYSLNRTADFLGPNSACSTPIAAALPARPKFEALQPGRDIEADLALHAQWLQRDRIV